MHGRWHPTADVLQETCHRAHLAQNIRRRRRRRPSPAAQRLRSPEATGGSTDASGKVEGDITFQTWNLRANFSDYFEGLITDFEKKYPGTHVKWVDQPGEGYADKISADAAGRHPARRRQRLP